MSEPGASLLDFYKRHGISPVRQDISDLPKHFTRRAAKVEHAAHEKLLDVARRVAVKMANKKGVVSVAPEAPTHDEAAIDHTCEAAAEAFAAAAPQRG